MPRCTIVIPCFNEANRLPRNMGKAEAVRRGMVEGLRFRPDFIGYWDADLATPLDVAVPFMRVLQQQPQRMLVMGSRVALLGHRIERQAARKAASRVFSAAVSCALGVPVYDSQCGAKLFRNVAYLPDLFAQPFRSRWIFDVEILARLRGHGRLGDMVYEFPLDEWRDVHGSKLRGNDFVKAAYELLGIWRTYRRLEPQAIKAVPQEDRLNEAA